MNLALQKIYHLTLFLVRIIYAELFLVRAFIYILVLLPLFRILSGTEVNSRDIGKLHELLGLHPGPGRHDKISPLRLYIVFNARIQQFQVVKGITNTELCNRLRLGTNYYDYHHERYDAARNIIRNAFSMLDPHGKNPGIEYY